MMVDLEQQGSTGILMAPNSGDSVAGRLELPRPNVVIHLLDVKSGPLTS
jgi:hypothetical protein